MKRIAVVAIAFVGIVFVGLLLFRLLRGPQPQIIGDIAPPGLLWVVRIVQLKGVCDETTNQGGDHWCGGTFVNEDYILTARHCFDEATDKRKLKFIVAAQAGAKGGKAYARCLHDTQDPELAPDNADAALALLKSPVCETEVKPASLATAAWTPGINDEYWALGWGETLFGFFSDELMKSHSLHWFPETSCERVYGSKKHMFCTHGFGPLGGDSGGPLVGASDVVMGVVSDYYPFGGPALYANVSSLRLWINDHSKTTGRCVSKTESLVGAPFQK